MNTTDHADLIVKLRDRVSATPRAEDARIMRAAAVALASTPSPAQPTEAGEDLDCLSGEPCTADEPCVECRRGD